jgi:hypothetical protein
MCFTQCVRILDEQRVHQAAMMLRELNVFNRSNTMTTYIGNAFSLGMVPRHLLGQVRLTPCKQPNVAGLVSCVGHADTAAVLGVPMARISVTLNEGDILYVAQLRGGRLPEGSTTLPEGFGFDWIRVEVI